MNLDYPRRLSVLGAIFVLGMVPVLGRLFTIQIADAERWQARACASRRPDRVLTVPRGVIRDARGRALAEDGECFDLVLKSAAWLARLHRCGTCGREVFYRLDTAESKRRCTRCRRRVMIEDGRDLRPIARLLGLAPHDLLQRIEERADRLEERVLHALGDLEGGKRSAYREFLGRDYGWRPVTLMHDVPYEAAREVELHRDRNPALSIVESSRRRFPGGAEFAHLLGRPPDGGGRGSRLEGFLDPLLRGEPGYVWHARDDSEEVVRLVEPVAGVDVHLTIDSDDQRLAMAAIGGGQGALVVVHAETGAVLALASAPSYDPERYADTLRAWPADTKNRDESPLFDRSFASLLVPGSIVKPFTAVAALAAGFAEPSRVIHCARNLVYRGRVIPDRLRCHTSHGDMNLHDAIAQSCNIYFETLLAEMLDRQGYPRFLEVGRAFGLGRATGLEMEAHRRIERLSFAFDGARTADLIGAAIGQGRMLLTPAQVARAYAGLATGRLPALHVVARAGHRPTAPRTEEVGLPAALLEPIREGLRDVARPGGTAARFGLSRWGIACKTGTAQKRTDRIIYNSWMAGFLPAQQGRPPIAFAMVILDTTEGGGDECGPRIARFLQQFYGESQG